MKCETVYLHICDHLDEDIDSPRCRQIKRHLDDCPDCREYLASIKSTIALYRAMPDPPVPADTHRDLFRTISTLTAVPVRKSPQKRSKRHKV